MEPPIAVSASLTNAGHSTFSTFFVSVGFFPDSQDRTRRSNMAPMIRAESTPHLVAKCIMRISASAFEKCFYIVRFHADDIVCRHEFREGRLDRP